MFRIGIEQEFVFLNKAGEYVDADNTEYSLFRDIVDAFPSHPGDDRFLECKSLETTPKRCYVEGFERHDADGKLAETLPKALEIRTLPHRGVEGVVGEFRESYRQAMQLAGKHGLHPVLVSYHPYKTTLKRFVSLDEVELRVRGEARLDLAKRAMFTHGLHVNVSLDHLTKDKLQDRVRKICFYTPSIIPWSYSSPFYRGELFEGLCSRNYYRASSRNMVDLNERLGAYVIEFRGFDACGDFRLLDAVLRLFCGILLDEELPGRTGQQDSERLMLSSLRGYSDASIRDECRQLLKAAHKALGGDPGPFMLLETMLEKDNSYATQIKQRYNQSGSVRESVSGLYDF
jgi:hypothetical protein